MPGSTQTSSPSLANRRRSGSAPRARPARRRSPRRRWRTPGRDGAAGAELDDPDAALELVVARRDRHAAEDRGLADLRQADERQAAVEGQAAGVAGQRGHVSRRPVARSTRTSRAHARVEHPEAAVVPARRVRHGQTRASPPRREATSSRRRCRCAACRQPPGVSVCAIAVTKRGRSVPHRQAVEVAAVLRRPARDERRPPARHEAVARVEAGQAGEQRVDEPQVRLAVGVVPQAISWPWIAPVTIEERGRQQAS